MTPLTLQIFYHHLRTKAAACKKELEAENIKPGMFQSEELKISEEDEEDKEDNDQSVRSELD